MKLAFFNTKAYDREFFTEVADSSHDFTFLEPRLTPETVSLAQGHQGVCVFVHDQVDAEVISGLAELGCKLVAVRAAGYNNIDLEAAQKHGIKVVRVPAYSPEGVAEFTVGLMLSLNRGIHRAYDRVRRGNFSLEGLMGFDTGQRTVGILGTGKIGQSVARIMLGFGCEVLAYDMKEVDSLKAKGVRYVGLDALFQQAHIISLHVPLLNQTRRIIDAAALERMRDGVMLINTSRGELIDTDAVIRGLKSGKVGALGVDVYEEEEGIFFEDLSNSIVDDDRLMRLTTFPNVILTSHQAFFTREAMGNIAQATIDNITAVEETGSSENEV